MNDPATVLQFRARQANEYVPLDEISPHPDNFRFISREDPDDLDLIESITSEGQRDAAWIAPTPPGLAARGVATPYVIVYGHRRYFACREAGLAALKVEIHPELSERDIYIKQLQENIERKPLTPLEEARKLELLTRSAERGGHAMSYEAAAQALHQASKSKGWVSKRISLLKLPETILAEIESGDRSPSAGYALARLAERPDLLARVVEETKGLDGNAVEAAVKAALEGTETVKRGRPPKEKPQGKVITYVRKATRLRSTRDTEARKVDLPVELVKQAEEKFGRYRLRAMVSLHTRAWLEEAIAADGQLVAPLYPPTQR